MSTLDISDIDVIDVVLALWRNTKPALFFASGFPSPPEPSRKEIVESLSKFNNYLGYLSGRCIKTDFSDLSAVETRLYDRDAGQGAFAKIVSSLREPKL